MSEGSSSSTTSSSSCLCQNCPQNIRILLDASSPEYFNFIEHHATRYTEQYPHIGIRIDAVPDLPAQLLQPNEWDASIFPSQLLGTLAEREVLWDLSHFIKTSANLNWAEVLPFFRNPTSVYWSSLDSSNDDGDGDRGSSSGAPRLIPLDGDLLSMYYRRDIFEQYNITIPRTWEEYNQAAAFFDGMPLGPGGTPIFGSCVSRGDRCANEYWTSLILASMTQGHGSSSGYFLDPSTLEPLFGPAMQETLRILREQFEHGHEDELTGDCLASNFAFNEGICALTYNWGNQITGSDGVLFDVGVAPTPGSQLILDRHTKTLVNCTTEQCPHAIYYEDIGLVNQAPYAAYGGWVSGVSNQSPEGQQYAAADFLAYVSNSLQSLSDVLPNSLSSFAQPYRYSHVTSSNWIDAGYGQSLASDYTEAVRRVNSENSVLELRINAASRMREIVDQEVFQYLFENINPLTSMEDQILRRETTTRMEQRIEDLVRSENRPGSDVRLSDSYRRSIGYTDTSDQDLMNYINGAFRDAAWGLSGLMCVTAVSLMIWTVRHRNNRVMKAFQPFLLLQSTIGLLLMSSSIIPLGFDDSFYDVDVLDITCMLAPWLYVVGFTIFFASVYAKIRECIKIYEDPRNHTILLVHPKSCVRLCVRLLILNGSILGIWTITDPLRWRRQEVEGGIVLEDGTVETYGACRGEYASLGFQVALFALNMTLVLIATLQAFKCRFLVLEYNEMQWLPLSVFPFLEVWIVGSPILLLVREDATVTFVVLSMMIVASTTVGGMAVFAPKDWYIRKFYHSNPNQGKGFPERTSSAGIMVLQHPTVESQKQIESLCFKVEQMEGWNTELEIEIRLMKEKFKELTTSEKFYIQESLIRDALTDSDTNEYRSSKGMEEYDQNLISKTNDEGLAAMEHFQQVWKMPEEEEEDDTQVASMPKPTSFQSVHSVASSLENNDDMEFYPSGVESAPEIRKSEAVFSGMNHVLPLMQGTMSDTSSETSKDPHLRSMVVDNYDDDQTGRSVESDEPRTFNKEYGDDDANYDGRHDPGDRINMTNFDDSHEADADDQDPLIRLATTGFDEYNDNEEIDVSQGPLASISFEDNDDDDDFRDHSSQFAMTGFDNHKVDNDDYIPQKPLSRLALTGFANHEVDSDNDVPQKPLSRLAMTGFDDYEANIDVDDAPPDPLSRFAMTGFDENGDDKDTDIPQKPLSRLTMTGFDDTNDAEDGDPFPDPVAQLAMIGSNDGSEQYTSQNGLAQLATIGDENEEEDEDDDLYSRPKSSDGDSTDDGQEQQESNKDIISRIIAQRLAATDAGDETENDALGSRREDPLERLMRMSGDCSSEASQEGTQQDPQKVTSKEDRVANDDGEGTPDKDLIARIIAMRLAAADEEDGNGSVHSTHEDPLERIMNMNAEDRLISAVTLMRYLEPQDNDDKEDEDVIIRNKDFRDLSSMIQDNELEELEKRAASLAESVKTKLTVSDLADLTHETEMTVDSDTGMGYLALAKGGHKDIVNTSHVMNGLDISKISDDGDRLFVSMSDSILDSPGRVKSDGQAQPLLGIEMEFPNVYTRPSAGESSTDPKQRKSLSAAASAALNEDKGYVTQFAGEPSQGETSRFGLGMNGSTRKETIHNMAFKSPPIPKKRPAKFKTSYSNEPESPVNKSYMISDWAAVGGLANVLADWSDSQSSTSYAESNPDSITSYEATTRASLLATPIANELDELVGQMDWDGVKLAAQKYETSGGDPIVTAESDVNTSTLSALENKRRKKRELEAWRESLTKSFTKN